MHLQRSTCSTARNCHDSTSRKSQASSLLSHLDFRAMFFCFPQAARIATELEATSTRHNLDPPYDDQSGTWRKKHAAVSPHDRHYRLQRGFSVSHESLKESSQVGLMTYGNQRWHVQSPPQMTTAPSANPGFLVDGDARSETLSMDLDTVPLVQSRVDAFGLVRAVTR
jgi:hypothetical protein